MIKLRRYVWRPEWCWPYESAWGLLQKFKYANAVTTGTFKKLFNLRSPSTSNRILSDDLYVYRTSPFSVNDFYVAFNITHDHFSCLDVFLGNDLSQIIHAETYYCPECMKFGYHSYLHQLKFFAECPFHNVHLVRAEYEGTNVPYSIDIKHSEAYSIMQDRTKLPAARFVDILPSNELVNGIWDSAPDFIQLEQCNYNRILFFNPTSDISYELKIVQEETMNRLKTLFLNSKEIHIPSFVLSLKECDERYNELLHKAKKWFEDRHHIFEKNSLAFWYVTVLINELLKDIDSDIL